MGKTSSNSESADLRNDVHFQTDGLLVVPSQLLMCGQHSRDRPFSAFGRSDQHAPFRPTFLNTLETDRKGDAPYAILVP